MVDNLIKIFSKLDLKSENQKTHCNDEIESGKTIDKSIDKSIYKDFIAGAFPYKSSVFVIYSNHPLDFLVMNITVNYK